MKKKTSEMTIAELRARAAEIRTEVNAEGADLDALEAEADEISQRIAQYETEQRRLGIAAKVADGAGAPQDNPTAHSDAQTRAQQFKENRRAVLGVEETRAVLVFFFNVWEMSVIYTDANGNCILTKRSGKKMISCFIGLFKMWRFIDKNYDAAKETYAKRYTELTSMNFWRK